MSKSNAMKIKQCVTAVACVAAKENTNYAIAGVNIGQKKGKVTTMATDGRMAMIVTHDAIENGDFKPITLPVGSLRKFRKSEELSIETTDVNGIPCASVGDGKVTRNMQIVAEKFPNCQKIVPDAPILGRIAVNSKLLGKMLEAMCEISSNGEQHSVVLTIHKPKKIKGHPIPKLSTIALTMRGEFDGVEVTGVLMPVNVPEGYCDE